jgi:uncharacterized membrane protein YhfC
MVSSAALAGIAVCAILSLVWPVAIFVVCRRRMTLSARNVLVGAGVFFVFSQVLEKGLHAYLLKANPATAAWFHAHAIAFALYGCLAAGLFEEVGRYLGMRLLVRASGNPGTAVAYGIGHGGLEAVLIGSLAMAVFYDAGQVFDRWQQINFHDVHTDYGFGFRVKTAKGVFMRVDTAFSHEGVAVWARFNNIY